MRRLFLLTVLAVGVVPAVSTRAQDKPAPRLDDQTSLAKSNIERLQSQLAEYTAGKRPDRDGYIILRQLLNNYQVLRADSSSAAQEIQERLIRLIKANPEFNSLTDGRLSDEIKADKRKAAERDAGVKRAHSWIPPDKQPLGYVGAGRELAVRYQFRIDFYKLPDEITIDIQPGPLLTLTKQGAGGGSVRLSDLRPVNTLAFQQSFELLPRMVERSWVGPMLVCTHPFKSVYGPRDVEESKMVEALGHRNTIPHVSQSGTLRNFCGAISTAGEVLFTFPVSTPTQEKVFAPVGASENGNVAIAFGRAMTVIDGDDSSSKPGNFYEVLVWHQRNGLRRIPLSPPEVRILDLERRFFRDEL